MSGDLADPGAAIPKGTLSAIGITFASYMGLVWLLGTVCFREVCSLVESGRHVAVCREWQACTHRHTDKQAHRHIDTDRPTHRHADK